MGSGCPRLAHIGPARSAIDVVVMVQREPDKAAIRRLRRLHRTLAHLGGLGGQLHCLYVPVQNVPDPARLYPYWAGDRMTHRARLARRIMRCGVQRLSRLDPGGPATG